MPRGRKPGCVPLSVRRETERNIPKFKGKCVPPCDLTAEALEEWRRIAPELEAAGLLSIADVGVMRAYCEAFAGHAAATRQLLEEGPVLQSRYGQKLNPLIMVQSMYAKQMVSCGLQLGLTPKARGQIKRVAEDKKDDKPEAKGRFFKA